MNRSVSILTILLILSATLWAQLDEKLTIFISGGAATPVESFIFASPTLVQSGEGLDLARSPGNFEDFYNNGLNIEAGLDYALSENFSLLGRFSYSYFNFSESTLEQAMAAPLGDILAQLQLPYVASNLALDGGAANFYMVTAGIRAGVDLGMIRPYLTGGGGYMRASQDQVNISYTDDLLAFYDRFAKSSENALVVTGGGGVVFQVSQLAQPYVQFDYVNGMTGDVNTIFYGARVGLQLGLKRD